MSHFILDARTATPHFPGIGRYVRNLAQALMPEIGETDRLSVLWQAADPAAWKPTVTGTSQIAAVAAPVSPFGLAQQWQIPRLLRNLTRGEAGPTPAIYHSAYYLMPYRPTLPAVVTIYDLSPMLLPQTVSLRARLLFRFTTRLALRAAQQIIVISSATRADLLARFSIPAGRVTVIPLAADARFSPQPASVIQQARSKYALPERYLLYLGINKPHKNLVRLIEAYSQLDSRHVPPLVIAGAWDARYPEPKARTAQLGMGARVQFLGAVEDLDLPALYTGCTFFIFPSLYEGFGLPVIEAMACGAPVLCSHSSSFPEVAGDAALYFDPQDVQAIAATIQRGLDDEGVRQSLAEQSLPQAGKFSWQQTAQETLAVYRQAELGQTGHW
jgi:glycosyltransferase involved in cell wall biosynthesis